MAKETKIRDAGNAKNRVLSIKVDPHGAVIEIEGSNEVIILDLSNDSFNIHIADGDNVERPAIYRIKLAN